MTHPSRTTSQHRGDLASVLPPSTLIVSRRDAGSGLVDRWSLDSATCTGAGVHERLFGDGQWPPAQGRTGPLRLGRDRSSASAALWLCLETQSRQVRHADSAAVYHHRGGWYVVALQEGYQVRYWGRRPRPLAVRRPHQLQGPVALLPPGDTPRLGLEVRPSSARARQRGPVKVVERRHAHVDDTTDATLQLESIMLTHNELCVLLQRAPALFAAPADEPDLPVVLVSPGEIAQARGVTDQAVKALLAGLRDHLVPYNPPVDWESSRGAAGPRRLSPNHDAHLLDWLVGCDLLTPELCEEHVARSRRNHDLSCPHWDRPRPPHRRSA